MSKYPENWDEIAKAVKDRAGWKCEWCGQPHDSDPKNGNILTVQHLDRDTENPDAPMAALCQRCHMRDMGSGAEFHRERERLGQINIFEKTQGGNKCK